MKKLLLIALLGLSPLANAGDSFFMSCSWYGSMGTTGIDDRATVPSRCMSSMLLKSYFSNGVSVENATAEDYLKAAIIPECPAGYHSYKDKGGNELIAGKVFVTTHEYHNFEAKRLCLSDS